MASCYAALLSLFQTLNHIKNHPRPPISLDQKQVDSLAKNLTYFQHFLESYPTEEDEDLESRIKAAAYAAEDVIETHIVDRIHHAGSNISPVDLSQGLKRVIQDMDLIKKEVMEVITKEKIKGSQHHHLHTNSSAFTDFASMGQSSTAPRLDDVLIARVLDKLIKLWVSEGILKPNKDKSLEEVAKEYLKELIERNMILVHKLRWNGEAKRCKIHDLLRDVCSREAERQKFLCLWQQEHHTPQGINMERRICINYEMEGEEFDPEFLHVVESASLTRSLLYNICHYWKRDSPSLRLGLLRIYSLVNNKYRIVTCSNNAIFEHANLRYLFLTLDEESTSLSLCSLLWNLQTIEIRSTVYKVRMVPSEIWEMSLLRHVMLRYFILPDPPHGENNFVLENLQTLAIMNLKFSEEVIKRIPNIKTLQVQYKISDDDDDDDEELSNMCLNNLCRLQKLESLKFNVDSNSNYGRANVLSNMMSFPHSLKKLTLSGNGLSWDDLKIRIGLLPLLQFLGLRWDACRGNKWETVEGQFCSLKVLDISFCKLKCWDTEDTHFPRLERLLLRFVYELEEIPSSIGDIPTLKSIRLINCTKSAEDSANRIKEEQEENGNEEFRLIIDKN